MIIALLLTISQSWLEAALGYNFDHRSEVSSRLQRVKPLMSESDAISIAGTPRLTMRLTNHPSARLLHSYGLFQGFPTLGSFTVDASGRVVAVYGRIPSKLSNNIDSWVTESLIADIGVLPGISAKKHSREELRNLCDRLKNFTPQQVADIFEEYLRVAPLFQFDTFHGAMDFSDAEVWQDTGRIPLISAGLLGEDLFDEERSCDWIKSNLPSVVVIGDSPFVLIPGITPVERVPNNYFVDRIRRLKNWPSANIATDHGPESISDQIWRRIMKRVKLRESESTALYKWVRSSVAKQY